MSSSRACTGNPSREHCDIGADAILAETSLPGVNSGVWRLRLTQSPPHGDRHRAARFPKWKASDMSVRIAFGLLDTSAEANDPALSAKARGLTASSLRWFHHGDILEAPTVDKILGHAEAEYNYCLVQSYGHMIMERSGPAGSRPHDFHELLQEWLSAANPFIAGRIVRGPQTGFGIMSRCFLINLESYRRFGCPSFGANLSHRRERCVTAAPARPDAATADRAAPLAGGQLVAAGLRHDAIMCDFDPSIAGLLVDLGSDLTGNPEALADIHHQAALARSGVFALNFEGYQDIEQPPPEFRPPVSALYSVAAGLKPNRILATHGFDKRTRVVYFDYSQQALDFRRLMIRDWDGRDFPGFLRRNLDRSLPGAVHYYLWPGTSFDNIDRLELDRLWRIELSRWGGGDAFAGHWSRYRTLPHEFLTCDILANQEALLHRIEDSASAVIWWSNAFCTTYSAWHYTLEEKRAMYERWIRGLGDQAPHLVVYGSDHSNSSVNAITAGEYRERYFQGDGDPLRARHFFRHAMRF
jgi:hypothetical protein